MNDEVLLIAIGYIANYFIIYKANNFLGNTIFIILSTGILMYATSTTMTTIGTLLLIAAIANLIYDIAKKW